MTTVSTFAPVPPTKIDAPIWPGLLKTLSTQLLSSTPDFFCSFSSLCKEQHLEWPYNGDRITLDIRRFKLFLHLAILCIPFDSNYYLSLYPDVKVAITTGRFQSPHQHYIYFGFFEDRLPFKVTVDDDYYVSSNPDIATAIEGGLIPSPQVHFERYGFKEGRLPRRNWSLLAGPSQ